MKFGDIAMSVLIIAIILLIIVPLNSVILDILLVANIAVAVIVLLITLNSTEPLQFSTFPSLLLILTIFRLGLNISATKLILGNNGSAGSVIKTFGEFVAQNNLAVGFIIFLIILVVQFIVITKGSERVAEVAARFTLDAMPGKQMAIDADLNTGIIDEHQARERRMKVQHEADFYGAMDGASKFVKGDAILSIIITIVNSVGGIIIGMVGANMTIGEVISTYLLATIGNGLVGQLPALLISTASGIIVTRAASDETVGRDLQKQLFSQAVPLIVGGAALFVINFIPGLPKIPILVMAALLLFVGFRKLLNASDVEIEEGITEEEIAAQMRRPENVLELLEINPIELELGYSLIPLADVNQGGDLLDRVVMIRRQCAIELGMIVPTIRLRDNIQLGANEYVLKIKGNEVARGEVLIDHYLAMNPESDEAQIQGIETVEPAFGLPAVWVNEVQRQQAEIHGYTIVDPPSVIATHLTEVLKRHGFELLGRQQVQSILDTVRKTQPALVDELVPKLFSLGELQKILANLLRENVSIRDMTTIIETLADYGTITRDTDLLTEYARQSLKRAITTKFMPSKKARVLTLDPELEQTIMDNIRKTERGSYVAIEPQTLQNIYVNLRNVAEKMLSLGIVPMVLTSPVVRLHFKKLTEQIMPDLVVLSYNEIEQNVEIFSDGVVTMNV